MSHGHRVLSELARQQAGCFTLQQALEVDVSKEAIRAQVAAGKWVRVHQGVYAVRSAPIPWLGRVWAAVLAAGPCAVTGSSALRPYGLPTFSDDDRLMLAVDHSRRILPIKGVAVRRRRDLAAIVHPARTPPTVRAEEAILQQAAASTRPSVGLSVIADACRHRLTTPVRLRMALADLPRLRGRAMWEAVVDDVAGGAESFLEIEYLRRVERAHGLPQISRQVVARADGVAIRRDGLWDEFGLVLELDGRLGHEWSQDRRADFRRDAAAIGDGLATLRIGYADVLDACRTARLIAAALTARGWTGAARPCGPRCVLASPAG
jgi:Transcriptional regulator, AbiEi antitoxin